MSAWPKGSLAKLTFLGSLLVLVVVGLWGVRLGFAEDSDSSSILRAAECIAGGSYQPSRTTGFPLYEGLVALLVQAGADLAMLNATSLLFMVASAVWSVGLARRIGAGRDAALFAGSLVALHPLVLINASALMETALSLVLALAFVDASLGSLEHPRSFHRRALSILLALLLVLTRLDAVALVLSVCAATTLTHAKAGDRRHAVISVVDSALVGVLALLVYSGLHGGTDFLSPTILGIEPFARRLLRAGLGAGNALGAAMIVAVILALLGRPSAQPMPAPDRARSAFRAALALGCLLYAVRYAALPDELEYLIIPMVLVGVFAMAQVRSRLALGLLLGLSVAQNLATMSVFQRADPASDRLRLALGLAAGPVAQDFAVRENALLLADARFLAWVAEEAGLGRERLTPRPYGIGLVSTGGKLLLSRSSLYKLDNSRFSDPERRSAYRTIVVCDEVLRPNRGFRVLQAPDRPLATEIWTRGGRLACRELH